MTTSSHLDSETLWTLEVEYSLGMEDPEPGSRRVSTELVGRYETEKELDEAVSALTFDENDEFSVLVATPPLSVREERARKWEAENLRRMKNDDVPF